MITVNRLDNLRRRIIAELSEGSDAAATAPRHEPSGTDWLAPRVAILVSVALVLLGTLAYYLEIHRQVGAFSDLLGRVANFQQLRRSGDIYSQFGNEAFTYPPGAILILCPIVLLPVTMLLPAWTVLVLAALALTFFLALRHLSSLTEANCLLVASAATVVSPFVWSAAYDNLFWGQVGTLLTLSIVADFLTVRGRWQGVLVGLATTLKIYPGVFIVVWLARRQYRQALVAMATTAVTTAAAFILWYTSAHSFLRDKLIGGQELTHLRNGNEAQASSSITAFFARPPYFLGHLTGRQAIGVALVVGAVAVVAAIAAARRGHELTTVLVVYIASILVAPVAWNHYFAFMPLLALVPLEIGWRCWTSRAAYVALAVNVVPWHRWKLAGVNQVLLPHHTLYLSYVAQSATLVSMLLILLAAMIDYRPRRGRRPASHRRVPTESDHVR